MESEGRAWGGEDTRWGREREKHRKEAGGESTKTNSARVPQ